MFRAGSRLGRVQPGYWSSLPGSHFYATRYRSLTAAGARSHGSDRVHCLGHRPPTRPSSQHGPRPDATRPAGGARSHSRRLAASLRRLWAAPARRPAITGDRPGAAPRASPLGCRTHPSRPGSDESRAPSALGADDPTLAARAWPGAGPARSAPGHLLDTGPAPSRSLGG
jgi:hypothetical protein